MAMSGRLCLWYRFESAILWHQPVTLSCGAPHTPDIWLCDSELEADAAVG